MSRSGLVVNAAELLREPGLRKHVSAEVAPADVDAAHPAIVGDLGVELDLESSLDDIVVTGTITVPWRGVCRRCAVDLDLRIPVDVEERYADSEELVDSGEALPIERGQLDLAGLVRDEALLTADEERLCRDDCAGLCPTCGADLNDGPCDCAQPPADDRWAALEQLRTQD
jgi:uncharacterized protein